MPAGRTFIGLINPKTPSNVGTIMRASGCYGVEKVFYTGQRYNYASKFITDTKDVHERIPLQWVETIGEAVSAGIKLVAVELAEGATPLPEYQHPENALYIFGPEDSSVPQDILNLCEDVVYIPTIGCMNLAATVNVLLYDRMAKSAQYDRSTDLIRSSRDAKNNLVVGKHAGKTE